MDHEKVRALYITGAAVAGGAMKKQGPWWPTQGEGTVLSLALAMEWIKADPERSRFRWLSMNTGREEHSEAKIQVIRAAGGTVYNEQQVTDGLCLVPGEAMLDLAVFPAENDIRKDEGEVALLTMESEMAVGHGVGHRPNRFANGYAWDAFKIVWLPSPRRLFVARVDGAERRATLRDALGRLIAHYPRLIRPRDTFVAVVLAAEKRQWADSQIGIWTGSEPMGWEPLFTAK